MASGKCGRKECGNDAEGDQYLWDEEGKKYKSCGDCHNDEFPVAEVEATAELECETCGGERFVEEGPSCSKPASDCCGGCFTSIPCPDCGEEPEEPDWDSIRKDRQEAEIDRNAEVDWESPY